MTFDRIDHQFRTPAPIHLECVPCGSTIDVRTPHASHELRWRAVTRREPDPDWAAAPRCPACRVAYEEYWRAHVARYAW